MDAQPRNQSSSCKISDQLFMRQLAQTRGLVTFLMQKQVLLNEPEVLSGLAALGSMRYSTRGRAATEEEWQKLYATSQGVTSQIPSQMLTAFSIWRLRRFFGVVPIVFLIMGIVALEATYLNNANALEHQAWYYFISLAAVLFWTSALGGLGTAAFFGTSLLAQLASAHANDEAKLKEITDYNYLQARLIVGVLFAFVLGLPFGRLSLDTASTSLYDDIVWNADLVTTAMHILAPFLLGFSTALVLAILDRLIEGMKTILGVGQPTQQPPPVARAV